MTFVISTMGSLGDFRPCLLVSRELIRRGHSVRMITHDKYRQECEKNGISFYDVGGSVDDFMKCAVGAVDEEGGFRWDGFSPFVNYFTKYGDIYRKSAVDALKGADCFLCFQTTAPMMMAAEAAHVPYLRFNFIPDSPVSAYTATGWKNIKLPGFLKRIYNICSFKISYYFANMLFFRAFRDWHKTLGVPKHGKYGYRYLNGKPLEMLFAGEEVFFPDSKRLFPPQHHLTGYWCNDACDVSYEPDDALRAFLEAGEKPIFIGFGSMTSGSFDQMKAYIIQAAKATGKRILLQAGWGGFTADELPENVHLVQFIPHEWLFTKVSGAVIHGGVGTTVTALKAGIPLLVVPFGTDQSYWGEKVYANGFGPMPIQRIELTAEKLTDGIMALDNPLYYENAQKAAAQMAKTNGVRNACDFVETFAKEFRI